MGLMDWIENNYERAAAARARGRLSGEAELMQQNAPQVQGLMGYNTMQTGPDGLTSGMSSGLMAADQNDPRTFMQLGTGLMGIPGYQQAGQQVLGHAVANQLGRASEVARLAEQRRYHDAQIDMQRLAAERLRAGMVGPFQDMAQYATQANGLRDDARAELAPFRQQMTLYNTVQDLVAEKGFSGMSLADDELFIKSYAKMLLPNESVMTEDMARIARSDRAELSSLRGFAAKLNIGIELSKEEREQIWSSMYRTAASAAPRYEQLRTDYTNRAERMYINPADVLNTAITMDTRRFSVGHKSDDDATQQEIQRQFDEQNRSWTDPSSWRLPWSNE